MTEAEWLAGEDANLMLPHLWAEKASARKVRLFACAVGRRLWDRFDQEAVRRAVELAELVADGRADPAALNPAREAASRSINDQRGLRAPMAAASSAYPDAWHAAGVCANQAALTGLRKAGVVAVLREVFGNPFRPGPVAPGWLTPTVADLAAAAYEERALPSGEFDPRRLAVLADALEEEGCADEAILSHLRSPGPHVRGCWRWT